MNMEKDKIKVLGLYKGQYLPIGFDNSFVVQTSNLDIDEILKENYSKLCKAVEAALNGGTESNSFQPGEEVEIKAYTADLEMYQDIWMKAIIKEVLYFKDIAIIYLYGSTNENNLIEVEFSRLRKIK